MPAVNAGRLHVARLGGASQALVRTSLATMLGLLALLLILSHSGPRRYITGADGRHFEVIQFARESRGQRHWVFLQYITSSSDQDSLQTEVDDLLPTLARTLDSLKEQQVQITASRPIIRINNIYSLYHSYTVWLERGGQQWNQEREDEPE